MAKKEARPKYTTVIFCKHWVNGSGWSYETILDVEESDYNLETLDWDEILFWLAGDDEGIKVIADESKEDNLITIVLYDAADYDENNTDAAEIERVERWESEIAKEYLAKTAD